MAASCLGSCRGKVKDALLCISSRIARCQPSLTDNAHCSFAMKRALHFKSRCQSQQKLEEEPLTSQSLVEDEKSHLEAVLDHDDYFQTKDKVSLGKLFKARVHLGHNVGLRHESMTPYIFGERLGQDIIDLDQTLPLLQHALNVCAHIVYRGGMVLLVTRNQQISPWVERAAKDVGEYAHCRPWKDGTFTNASRVFQTLPIFPELCIFFGTQDTVFEQHRAVAESSKLLIPSIGVVDTNSDISNITYPIPANDDTPDSVRLFLNVFKDTILKAKAKRKEDGLDLFADTSAPAKAGN